MGKGTRVSFTHTGEHVPRGLTARISGSHPGGPGSIPGNGKIFNDEDGIRTHAGRAHWISSPTP